MAELAEFELEVMLQEVKDLQKSKLLNESELSHLLKERRRLEYSLLKRERSIPNYLNYIEHEKCLLLLVMKRSKSKKGKENSLTGITKSIMDRIVRLHRQLCYRFQSNPSHWLSFIRSCDLMNRYLTAERVWQRFLQVHNSTDPQLWIGASRWTLHTRCPAQVRSAVKSVNQDVFHSVDYLYDRFAGNPSTMAVPNTSDCPEPEELAAVKKIKSQNREKRIMNRNVTVLKRSANEAQLPPWFRVFEDSRDYLIKGLLYHPASKDIYHEMVRLSLTQWHFFSQSALGSAVRMLAEKQNIDLPSNDDLAVNCMKAITTLLEKWPKDEIVANQLKSDLILCVPFLKHNLFLSSNLFERVNIDKSLIVEENHPNNMDEIEGEMEIEMDSAEEEDDDLVKLIIAEDNMLTL